MMASIHNESGKNPFSDHFMKCVNSVVTLKKPHSTIMSLISILFRMPCIQGTAFTFLPHVALA